MTTNYIAPNVSTQLLVYISAHFAGDDIYQKASEVCSGGALPAPAPQDGDGEWIIGIIAAVLALIVVVPGVFLAKRRAGERRAALVRIRQLKAMMEQWRQEGYDVSELEDLFN